MTGETGTVDQSTGDSWTWRYEGYEHGREGLREALCTVGNGYMATRGAAPEAWGASPAHYPGTYVAGCYNRLASHVAGRDVENEDLVNLPNWLPLRVRTLYDDRSQPGSWLSPDCCQVERYRLTLNMHAGTLDRRMRLRDHFGRVTSIAQTRLVHMGDPHLAVLRTAITPENWSGVAEVQSALDGDVRNAGVERYRTLPGRHLTDWRTGSATGDRLWLECATSSSRVQVALACRATGPWSVTRQNCGERSVNEFLQAPVRQGATVTLDKTVALHTSRDRAIGDPLHAALDRVRHAPPFTELLVSHATAWRHLWRRARLEVPGEAGRVLRLHLFHVLQTLSPHTAGLDVGVPARGLHGEAYRGHVFWDELFVLPYLNLHLPEVSRSLLSYRHRRLQRAVQSAAATGRRGALFPWQSGSDGREETQTWHLNPRSGRWLQDHSHLQHHVDSAVAYNVWEYAQVTGDTDFLHGPGAEMLLQIARFWADSATWDRDRERYRIRGVMGPDEYHDRYPEADRPGIDDNTYTNITAAWVLCRALELLADLPNPRRHELLDHLGLQAEETDRWEEVSRRLYVPWHRGVISQFDGYGDLRELDWDAYRARYGDIRRLDRDPRSRRRRRLPIPGVQTGRHADARLPLSRPSAGSPVHPARPPPRRRDLAGHHRLLPGTHEPRIDAQQPRTRLGPGPRPPRRGMGVLPGGAAQRRSRHPGRHHTGRCSPGRDGRNAGPGAAWADRPGGGR